MYQTDFQKTYSWFRDTVEGGTIYKTIISIIGHKVNFKLIIKRNVNVYKRFSCIFHNKNNQKKAICNMQYAICNMQYAISNKQYAICNMQYANVSLMYTVQGSYYQGWGAGKFFSGPGS